MSIKVDANIKKPPNAGKTFPVYLVKRLFVVLNSVLKIKYILLMCQVMKGCNLAFEYNLTLSHFRANRYRLMKYAKCVEEIEIAIGKSNLTKSR